MTEWTQAPRDVERSHLAYQLSRVGAKAVGNPIRGTLRFETLEELLAFAGHCARYDPRLFSILTLYFLEHWREVNPLALRLRFAQLKTPQVFAVIGEFVSACVRERECGFFFDYLCAGLAPVPPQLFFIDVYPPGSALALSEASESLVQFKKWGFLSRERPIVNTETRKTAGTWDFAARAQILKRLVARKKEISMRDYRAALASSLSRQQAIEDLRRFPHLKQTGKGRGSRWVLETKPQIEKS